MKKRYKIVSVLHSGRRGLRNEPVDDYKHEGLIGCVVESLLMEDLKQFECVHWDFVGDDDLYDWWRTSPVIQITHDLRKDVYWLETINTIYELEEVKTDGDSAETGCDES